MATSATKARTPRTGFTDFWLDRLPWLLLPQTSDGRIPFGSEFAAGVRQCLSMGKPWIDPAISTALTELADHAESRATEFTSNIARAGSHPAGGFAASNPQFVSLIPFANDESKLAVLRVVILLVLSNAQGLVGRSSLLNFLNRSYRSAKISPHPCIPRLANVWDGKELGVEELISAISPFLDSDFQRKVLRVAFDPDSTPPSPNMRAILVNRFENEVDRSNRALEQGDALLDIDNIDEVLGFQAYPAETEQEENDHVATQEANRQAALHLEGSLLPHTERSLTEEEIKSVLTYARAIIGEQRDSQDFLAVLAIVVMITTGHELPDVLHALERFARGHQPSASPLNRFAIYSDCWRVQIPLPEIKGPNPDKRKYYLPVASVVAMPWPKDVAQWLKKLSSNADMTRELSSHPQAVRARVLEWNETIRNAITRRFTERRATFSLPTQIYCTSGDFRISQVICGDSLSHSTAPLHYYAADPDGISATYQAALESWGIQGSFTTPRNTALVGGPYAGIDTTHLISAVEALRDRTSQYIGPIEDADFALRIRAFNAMACWTMTMFACAVAHRWTTHLFQVTRSQIAAFHTDTTERAGVTCFLDKAFADNLSTRVAVLDERVLDQFDQYFTAISKLIRFLKRQPEGRSLRRTIHRLCCALDGSGPVFLWIDGNPTHARAETFSLSTMKSFWPELEVTPDVWRNTFGTHASRFDLSPADVAHQMGHYIAGVPFDRTDPESPLDFANRTSASIGRYLGHFGFEVISGYTAAQNEKDQMIDIHEISARIVDDRNRKQDFLTKSAARPSNARSKSHKLSSEAAKRLLERDRPELLDKLHHEPVQVDISEVCRWIEELYHDATLQEQMDRNRALRRLLKRAARRTKSEIPLVPILTSFIPEVSPIQPVAIEAYKAAGKLLKLTKGYLKKNGKHGVDSSTPDSLAICVLILTLCGGIVRKQVLIDVINASNNAIALPDRPDTILVPVPMRDLSSNRNQYEESLLLDGDAATAIAALNRRDPNARVTFESLNEALSATSFLSFDKDGSAGLTDTTSKSSSLDALLNLAAEARKIVASGLRCSWESGEIRSTALNVDRDWAMRSGMSSHGSGTSSTVGSAGVNIGAHWGKSIDLGELITALGRAKSRNQLGPTRSAAEQIFSSAGHTITSAIACWIYEETQPGIDSGIELSTLSTYLSSVAHELFREFANDDLRDCEVEDITDGMNRVIDRARSASSRADRSAAMQRLSPFIAELAHADIDFDHDSVSRSSRFRAIPYIITRQESEALLGQLQQAAAIGEHSLATAGRNDAFYSNCAVHVSRIELASGARYGEVTGLALRDAIGHPIHTLDIRRRRRRGLKTKASARPLCLSQVLDSKHILELTQQREAMANHSLNKSESDLFRRPGDPYARDVQRELSEVTRDAIRNISNDPRAADTRAFRHLVATSSLLPCLPDRLRDQFSGLLDIPVPRIISRLPARMRWRYFTRRLGHGTPDTTASHYCHLIPILPGMGSGLPRLTLAECTSLIGENRERTKKRRQRTRCAYLVANQPFPFAGVMAHPYAKPAQTVQSSEPPTPNTTQNPHTIRLHSLGRLAMAMRQGKNAGDIAIELGTDLSRIAALERQLRHYNKKLGINYFERDRRSKSGRTRQGRDFGILAALNQIDAHVENGALQPSDLFDWCQNQDPSGARLLRTEADGRISSALPRSGEHLHTDPLTGETIVALRPPTKARSAFKLFLLVLEVGSRLMMRSSPT